MIEPAPRIRRNPLGALTLAMTLGAGPAQAGNPIFPGWYADPGGVVIDGQFWIYPTYSVAYAIADSPLGPFKRIGKILQQDPTVATGAGHHSVIQVPGQDKYYIVYHRRPLGETDGNHRVVCIDRMEFDDEGYINPVKITFEGVEAVRAYQPQGP